MGNCKTGEARLQGGPNVREGRVEVCINNAWGTVCNDQFGFEDAIVTCTQMNFSSEGKTCRLWFSHTYDYYTAGARVVSTSLPGSFGTPIFLRALDCQSSMHTNILQCESDLGITRCSHDQDVVIHCEG